MSFTGSNDLYSSNFFNNLYHCLSNFIIHTCLIMIDIISNIFGGFNKVINIYVFKTIIMRCDFFHNTIYFFVML